MNLILFLTFHDCAAAVLFYRFGIHQTKREMTVVIILFFDCLVVACTGPFDKTLHSPKGLKLPERKTDGS